MRVFSKYAILYLCVIGILIGLLTQLAQAQEEQQQVVEGISPEVEAVEIDQAELDGILAPIALYPDTLLSHIFVASTYPLELVQAARWRNENSDLSEEEALAQAEEKGWDPSVQALVPFTDLLNNLSEDLDWLQQLGDAFLLNEDQVLSSVQSLRRKAYEQGNLEDNEYIEVVEEDDDIVIETVHKEIVYVPYYDTRVVYGPWWWHSRPPLYWHRPAHYYWHAGFYWSPRIYIRPSFYFGGFHWHRRHVVVSHHYYRNPHRYHHLDNTRRVRVKEYQRWNHNPTHRRGVRYHQNTTVRVTGHQKHGKVISRSVEVSKVPNRSSVSLSRPINKNRYTVDVASRAQEKLKRQIRPHISKPVQYSSIKRQAASQSVKKTETRSSANRSSSYQKPKAYQTSPEKSARHYQSNRQNTKPVYNSRGNQSTRQVAPVQRHRNVSNQSAKARSYSQPRTTVKSSRSGTQSSGRDKQKRSNRKDY